MVRNYIRKTDKGSYSKDKLREAVHAIQSGALSGYRAAIIYKIPRMTLMDHVNNRRFKSNTLGRSTALSFEVEEKLASCIHLMEKNGFGLSKQELLEMVGDYVRLNNLSSPFKDNVPGEAWFYGFKNRHNLSVKKPQGVEYARKKAIDPFIINSYYDLLEKTIDDLNLRDKPTAIWNLDETSFSKDPSKTKVVGTKGHAATRVISSPGRDNTTVLLGANALGEKTPPLIIFKGKNVWDEWTSPDGYPGTTYAATTNGWMETAVFETFFKKTFLATVGSQRPILLIYDGHSTHVSLSIIEEARKQNVTILKLPPHSSHVLQPLDVSVMKSFKDKWDPLLVKWQRLNVGSALPKKEFARLIGEVWRKIDPQVITNGFRKTGIFPPCREEVAEKAFDAIKLKRWKESNQMVHDVKEANKGPTKQPYSLLTLSLKNVTEEQDFANITQSSPLRQTTNTLTNHINTNQISPFHIQTNHIQNSPKQQQTKHTQTNHTSSNHDLTFTSPSRHTTSTNKSLFCCTKTNNTETVAGPFIPCFNIEARKPLVLSNEDTEGPSNNQSTLNKKADDKIQILDNVKVKVNFTFEELLLSKVKAGNVMKMKRRKIAEGAEVITHDDVLCRKMEEAVKNIKKEKPLKKKQKIIKKYARNGKNKVKREKAKKTVSDSTSESEESLPELNDESDYENMNDFCEDMLLADKENEEIEKELVSDNVSIESSLNSGNKFPKVGDWLVVKFATKKTLKHYVGVVIEINRHQNPMVKYLRKKNRRDNRRVFSYPDVEDISELRHLEDIALFLPKPSNKERRGLIYFEDVSFYNYNIQ